MGDRIDLDAIRQRHAKADADIEDCRWDIEAEAATAHHDRGVLLAEVDLLRAENIDLASSSAGWAKQVPKLLAEVDRLTAELAESREAYDAVCRMIGSSLRGPE